MCNLEYIRRIKLKNKWLWDEKQYTLELKTHVENLRKHLEQIEDITQETNRIGIIHNPEIIEQYKTHITQEIATSKRLIEYSKNRIKYYQKIAKIRTNIG